MEVEILSRKLVVPSSPTPNHLRSYQISSLDQAEPSFVHPIFICIYRLGPDKNARDIIEQLRRSLSEILTLYYPLAGRFLDEEHNIITCNDQGAEFVEAKVVNDFRIGQLLSDMDTEGFNQLVPPPGASRPVLLIQVTMFEDGVAVTVRFPHRVADALSRAMFIGGWARTSRFGLHRADTPSLELASLFPLRDAARRIECGCSFKKEPGGGDYVTRRIVFDKATIQSLRDYVSKDGKTPSRVAVMTAFIWRSFIRACEAKHGHLRRSSLYIPVDMRRLVATPHHSFGNFFTYAIARFVPSGRGGDLRELVALFEEAKKKAVSECLRQKSREEMFEMVADANRERNEEVAREGVDAYGLSSWCGFPSGETDFGWGKLAWMGDPIMPAPITRLIDTMEGGGVEALVSLQEDEMLLFLRDPYILPFKKISPLFTTSRM